MNIQGDRRSWAKAIAVSSHLGRCFERAARGGGLEVEQVTDGLRFEGMVRIPVPGKKAGVITFTIQITDGVFTVPNLPDMIRHLEQILPRPSEDEAGRSD